MAENPRELEKTTPHEAMELPQSEQAHTESSVHKPPPRKALQSSPLLFGHTAGCIALALVLVFAIDGYNAGDTSTPRYVNGKLLLHASDITTLVSAGLVIIKFFTTSWAMVATWRCAYELTHNSGTVLTPQQLSFMVKYKFPPWGRYPFSRPRGHNSWIIAVVLLFSLPQPFIAPLLSGAVNWNPSFVPGGTQVPVNSTDPEATSSYWYQYVDNSYAVKRTDILRTAAGIASIAWSDSSTLSQNGTSLTGNGCRHLVNDNGLPVNSSVTNFTVPCIKFNGISWAMSAAEIPDRVSQLATGDAWELSVLNDTLELYTNAGHALLFNANNLWDPSRYGTDLPTASLVSGSQSLGLIIANQYTKDCTGLDVNNFGDVDALPQYKYNYGSIGSCYIFANVTFTAGVSISNVSTYISSRVVEDQTPIDEVVLQPNRWVQESLWLLPDLMTMVSQMNSSLLPTWDNVDLYVENLIRQSYLAAWDSFHSNWDTDWTISLATPQQSRVQASVSHARVYSWLAISLLQTVGGGLLIFLLLLGHPKSDEPDVDDSVVAAQRKEAKKDMKKLIDDLSDLGFSL